MTAHVREQYGTKARENVRIFYKHIVILIKSVHHVVFFSVHEFRLLFSSFGELLPPLVWWCSAPFFFHSWLSWKELYFFSCNPFTRLHVEMTNVCIFVYIKNAQHQKRIDGLICIQFYNVAFSLRFFSIFFSIRSFFLLFAVRVSKPTNLLSTRFVHRKICST